MRPRAVRLRIAGFTALIALVGLATSGLTLWLQYDAAIARAVADLASAADRHERLIPRLAGLRDADSSVDSRARSAAIAQVADAYGDTFSSRDSYRLSIVDAEGADLRFLVDLGPTGGLPAQSIATDAAAALPERLGLAGSTGVTRFESGAQVDLIAAYAPLPQLGAVLVIRRDLAPLNASYRKSALIGLAGAATIALIGALLAQLVGAPMLAQARAESALKRRDDELTRASTILEAAIENIAQVLYVSDADGTIVLANRRYLDLFGADASALREGRLTVRGTVERAVRDGWFGPGDPSQLVEQRLRELAAETAESYREM
ncbi:MAG: PAS-domain containing protein, partial [Alphaproteobacteria bacterium]|nr:PAS-domain containing protein [Alphaproteobacteria bacterium]